MKEIHLTTEDVRAELLDFFRHPRKEFLARAKHLKLVMDHIRSLPSDSLDLRRLATCPDLYSYEDEEFSFPCAGCESEADLTVDYCYRIFWMVERGKFFDTEEKCIAWFEEFVQQLIEDGQLCTECLGGYAAIGACDTEDELDNEGDELEEGDEEMDEDEELDDEGNK